MKYYVEYPIPIKCGLQCGYCFHAEAWELERAGKREGSKYPDACPFTLQDFIAWKDKHLSDGTEFLYELHGGEISFAGNQKIVLDVIDGLDGTFQLQTNGLGDAEFYGELIKRKYKIDRIGFTYHRKPLGSDFEGIADVFRANVHDVKDAGIYVYVKELLHIDEKDKIIAHKAEWEARGVEFRIQDFKGYRGRTDYARQYTQEDWALIWPEYCHDKEVCFCRDGYKQILIRGYDIFAGDVVACWNDPAVVGNICEDWYRGYDKVVQHNVYGRDVIADKKNIPRRVAARYLV